MSKVRSILCTATVLASLGMSRAGHAAGGVYPDPVPPAPSAAQVDRAAQTLGNPLNQPVTGAAEIPAVGGGEAPPSLETLQAARPGDQHGDGLKPGRAEALMRPPIITQAQLAFALGDGGQVARETACIYQITREAQLTSAPPNWREYLVRTWAAPQRPADAALPRSDKEVAYWNKWVAGGWGQGEKQAVDIFLSDLSRLQRDITGMARYRVLLRSGLVEQPRIAFQNQAVQGGRDTLHVGDQVVRITDLPGLQGRRAGGGHGCQ
jgi:defect-in-organelle-trafficking protein DotC